MTRRDEVDLQSRLEGGRDSEASSRPTRKQAGQAKSLAGEGKIYGLLWPCMGRRPPMAPRMEVRAWRSFSLCVSLLIFCASLTANQAFVSLLPPIPSLTVVVHDDIRREARVGLKLLDHLLNFVHLLGLAWTDWQEANINEAERWKTGKRGRGGASTFNASDRRAKIA